MLDIIFYTSISGVIRENARNSEVILQFFLNISHIIEGILNHFIGNENYLNLPSFDTRYNNCVQALVEL